MIVTELITKESLMNVTTAVIIIIIIAVIIDIIFINIETVKYLSFTLSLYCCRF